MFVKVARIACLGLYQGEPLIKENSQRIVEPFKDVSISTQAKQEAHPGKIKTKVFL